MDLCDVADLTLPRERGRGLYSGICGIGGGIGSTVGGEVSCPDEVFDRGASTLLATGFTLTGTEATLVKLGRLGLSVTGLGPSLTFGFGSNLLKSYGSSLVVTSLLAGCTADGASGGAPFDRLATSIRVTSSSLLGEASVSIVDASDAPNSLTEVVDRELREVMERWPDSSRTRNCETEVFGGPNGDNGGDIGASPLIRMAGAGVECPLMTESALRSALIRCGARDELEESVWRMYDGASSPSSLISLSLLEDADGDAV